jgi:hypothetical protein
MTDFHTTGTCLCGSVQLTANVGDSVGACHCDICRKWGGGPLLALNGGTDLEIDGAEHISTYGSTEWAERAFCSRCGTHLFIRVKESGRYIIPAGLFPLDDGLNFDHQIFIDKQSSYYCFANETQNLTGEQVFAQANQSDA